MLGSIALRDQIYLGATVGANLLRLLPFHRSGFGSQAYAIGFIKHEARFVLLPSSEEGFCFRGDFQAVEHLVEILTGQQVAAVGAPNPQLALGAGKSVGAGLKVAALLSRGNSAAIRATYLGYVDGIAPGFAHLMLGGSGGAW
jgi:hypothetical protein